MLLLWLLWLLSKDARLLRTPEARTTPWGGKACAVPPPPLPAPNSKCAMRNGGGLFYYSAGSNEKFRKRSAGSKIAGNA